MKLTYYGHACFAVDAAGTTLLFDPFITENPLAKKIDINQVKADFILVSHGHGDHVADLVAIAKRTRATVIAPFEVGSWFEKKGVENVQAMNHGGTARFSFGTVKLTAAVHSSSMPDGSYGGNPCGFVVESAGGSFYYSGDTALTMDMKLIGESSKLDFAVLPIGDFFTMGITDAVRAAELVEYARSLVCTMILFPQLRLIMPPRSSAPKRAGKSYSCRRLGKRSRFEVSLPNPRG